MQAPPPKSPRRKLVYTSPPHSPSLSLSGLERPVPHTSPLSQTSFLLPPTPPHTRSYDSLPSKLNKPLPETPLSETPATRPTSSIYSQIDETMRIIESYGEVDSERKASSTRTQTPTHAQHSYFSEQNPKGKAPEYLSSRSYSDRPVRWTEKSPFSSASVSIYSSNIAPSQTSLPMQSARTVGPTPRQKANTPASRSSSRKKAPTSEINIALSFDSIPYDSTFGHFPAPISPRITDVIDYSLVPRPLNPRASTRISAQSSQPRYDSISKPTKQSKLKPTKSPSKKKDIGTSFLDLDDLEDQEELHSHFSRTSSSDSSWVLHPSFTGHLMAAVKDKMRPKSKEKRKQKERERVTSHASARYPHMNPYGRNSSSSEGPRSGGFRRGSQALRRGSQSLRRGSQTLKSAMYDAARKFSTSTSEGSKSRKSSMAGPSQPKQREKTLAIPTSPYQRYGAKIWEAPKKQKKTNPKKEESKSKLWRSSWRAQPTQEERRAEAVRERRISLPLLSQHHVDGRGGQGQKGKDREREREGREERGMSSALQYGSKEIVSAFDRLTLKRSSMDGDEKRRAKLKASIRLIGPSDQFADGRVNHWL